MQPLPPELLAALQQKLLGGAPGSAPMAPGVAAPQPNLPPLPAPLPKLPAPAPQQTAHVAPHRTHEETLRRNREMVRKDDQGISEETKYYAEQARKEAAQAAAAAVGRRLPPAAPPVMQPNGQLGAPAGVNADRMGAPRLIPMNALAPTEIGAARAPAPLDPPLDPVALQKLRGIKI